LQKPEEDQVVLCSRLKGNLLRLHVYFFKRTKIKGRGNGSLPRPFRNNQALLLNVLVEVGSISLNLLDDVGTAFAVAVFSESDRTGNAR
jgi:hypothetical protein